MVESLFWNLGHQSHSPTLILAGGIFDTAASSESFCNGFFYHFIYQFIQTTSLSKIKEDQFRPNSNQAIRLTN